MKRTLELITLGSVLVGAVTIAVVSAASGGTSASGPATIHVIEHATTDVVSNDAVPSGDSAGDVLTFANDVFNSANSKRAGRDQGYCVRIGAGKSWECEWTLFLAAGQLTVAGPFYDKRNSRLAVTGGTGGYANARGWMQLKSRAGGTQFDFVYHLTG